MWRAMLGAAMGGTQVGRFTFVVAPNRKCWVAMRADFVCNYS